MHKTRNYFCIILLVMCFITMVPENSVSGLEEAAPNKTTQTLLVLGDSIAYGISADDGASYVDLLFEALKIKPEYADIALVNASIPGERSIDLLNKLKNDHTLKQQVSSADTISISIGGNDIFIPVLVHIARMYQLSINQPDFYEKLNQNISGDPQLPLKLATSMPQLMQAGVDVFKTNWGPMMAEIDKLAPEADVYVLTLYNPSQRNNGIFAIADPYIKSINATITEPDVRYSRVDIYQPFMDKEDEALVDFDLFAGKCDVHPTNSGHRVIFEEHLKAIEENVCGFADINQHWAKRNIKRLYKQGIVSGYSSEAFEPDKPMTRVQAAVVIVKALGIKPVDGMLSFIDASGIPGWGSAYIKAAIERKIIAGHPGNTFNPSDSVTRAEFAVMVMKGLGETPQTSDTTQFADDGSIPSWSKSYIAKAHALGIVSGYPDNTFQANASVRRAEVCVMLSKIFSLQAE